jgi:class 3 adenylate cyclase/TolB-like protein/tetratricopeptide (TPR) repeat protein
VQRDSRKIAAILAADVVEYSRLMGADEAGTLAALKSRRAIFEELVREFHGREFGSVGDSLMAEFGSAVNAVSCALELQQRVAAANAALPQAARMQLRIGVNLGDVIEEKGSVFGDAVNVAARLQALAKPGGVLISGAVWDHVHLKVRARYVAAGKRQVKNIAEPVRTFEVLPPQGPGVAGRIAGFLPRVASWRVRRAALVVATLAAAIALGQYWREIPLPGTGRNLGAFLQPQEAEAAPNTIAVLPFVNMSGHTGDDYLGDGLAEELSNRIARIPGLQVAARTSTFAFKGKQLGVGEIAARLGVRYVIEGSVRREASFVRVNAALVEAASGTRRWTNSFESQSGDFLAIEGNIGAQLQTALETLLGTPGRTPAQLPRGGNSVAYDYFLQGRAYLRDKKGLTSLDAAEQLFQRALAEQPDFARAWAGLCEMQVERYSLLRETALVTEAEDACNRARALDSSAQEVYEAEGRLRLETGDAAGAEAAYRKALALVPQSPDVLMGLGAALADGGKTGEAEATLRRAITAQPRYAAAHSAYAIFLFRRGRAAEAIAAFERATALEPDNAIAFSNLGGLYLYTGDFDRAAPAFARSLALKPDGANYSNAGTALYYRGRYREAAEMFREATELAPSDHRFWGNYADALRFDGRDSEALLGYRHALDLADAELAINPKHAVNHAQAAYYATRLGDRNRARASIALALPAGDDDAYVHYYVALAELGLDDSASALRHAKRARDLGYPEALLRAAPELGDLRKMI